MQIKLKKNNGFTLIELLVVIAIIGILAALSLVSFTTSQRQARDTQRRSDIKQYSTALEAFANGTGGLYPAHTSALSMTKVSNPLCEDLELTGCPVDPDASRSYYYISDGDPVTAPISATHYVLWARLESSTNYWVVCSNGKSGASTAAPSSSACPI